MNDSRDTIPFRVKPTALGAAREVRERFKDFIPEFPFDEERHLSFQHVMALVQVRGFSPKESKDAIRKVIPEVFVSHWVGICEESR